MKRKNDSDDSISSWLQTTAMWSSEIDKNRNIDIKYQRYQEKKAVE